MPLNAAWRKWLIENLQKGCTQESILASMLQNQFSHAVATAHIAAIAADIANNRVTLGAVVADEKYHYEASRIASGNTLNLSDCQVKISMRLTEPDIVVFDNFMSAAECEHLIALSVEKLERSGVVDPETGKTIIIPARSSEGCYFHRGENAFIQQLDTRISALMNWPETHGEGLQILHYENGGEYRPHFDYFPIDQTGSAAHLAKGGQRVATFIMYLNDVEGGGETIFPEVGLRVVPRQGSAVYFSYANAQGQVDPATLHGGAPVLAGEKWIATKWMRQGNYV
ncbi:MAG: 2-oxoglutarate-dependent dioxygenase [Methylococcaceae bacterium]|nr:2-oxoglutarate-dependent dioxygenase [Methylococcaceae bacterium]